MAPKAQALTINYVAWDTDANAGKTNDEENHTLRWVKDGVSAAPINSPSQVDATNAPGIYKLALTGDECDCWVGTLCGKSSTANVSLMPLTVTFESTEMRQIFDFDGDGIIGSADRTTWTAWFNAVSSLTTSIPTEWADADGFMADFFTAVADAVLIRAVENVEATADKHSLGGLIMFCTNFSIDGITLTAKKPSDDSVFATYTLLASAGANPIIGVS